MINTHTQMHTQWKIFLCVKKTVNGKIKQHNIIFAKFYFIFYKQFLITVKLKVCEKQACGLGIAGNAFVMNKID